MIRHLPRSLKQVPPSLIPTAVEEIEGGGTGHHAIRCPGERCVWGTEPESVKSLKTWLLKQRIPLIDDVKLNQLAHEKGLHQPVSNPDVLKLAKTLGANQVVFVDADIYQSRRDEMLSFLGQSTMYKASLFVRALNAETGEIDWSGKAQSTEDFTNLSEGIHQLTCHALATAWGLRAPGTATASSVCLPGQSVMVLAEPHTARYILAIAKAFRTVYAKQVVAQGPDQMSTQTRIGRRMIMRSCFQLNFSKRPGGN